VSGFKGGDGFGGGDAHVQGGAADGDGVKVGLGEPIAGCAGFDADVADLVGFKVPIADDGAGDGDGGNRGLGGGGVWRSADGDGVSEADVGLEVTCQGRGGDFTFGFDFVAAGDGERAQGRGFEGVCKFVVIDPALRFEGGDIGEGADGDVVQSAEGEGGFVGAGAGADDVEVGLDEPADVAEGDALNGGLGDERACEIDVGGVEAVQAAGFDLDIGDGGESGAVFVLGDIDVEVCDGLGVGKLKGDDFAVIGLEDGAGAGAREGEEDFVVVVIGEGALLGVGLGGEGVEFTFDDDI
jgi:hypothetical protein